MPDWKNIKIVRYWKEKVGHWGEKKSKEKGGRGHRLLSKQKKWKQMKFSVPVSSNFWNCSEEFQSHKENDERCRIYIVDVGFWLLKNIPSWCVTKIIALMISVRIFTPTPFREMNTLNRKDPPEFGNAPLTPFCPNHKNKSNAGISVIFSITFGTLVAVF